MEGNQTEQPVLLYDGDCPLCVRFAEALGRLPGTDGLARMSARDDSVYAKFPQLNKEECLKELHVLDAQGNVRRGTDAITFLIEQFPGVQKFAWLIESNMGQKAIKFFHDVADHAREELLKRCSACNKS